MEKVTRRFTVCIDGITMVDKYKSKDKEKQVHGTIRVDEWASGQSIMNTPTQSGILSFYLTKSTFAVQRTKDGDKIPFTTEEEMESLQNAIRGYYYGTERKQALLVHWIINNVVAYQICTEFTGTVQTDENGRLLIFENEEDAKSYLDGMQEKRLEIRKVMITSRRF